MIAEMTLTQSSNLPESTTISPTLIEVEPGFLKIVEQLSPAVRA